jgi:hypothetical protein
VPAKLGVTNDQVVGEIRFRKEAVPFATSNSGPISSAL